MRSIACLLSLLLTSALAADDWLPLLNGRDLSGWRANNDPDSFKVQDGVLRLQASGQFKAHLFYVGDRSEGFESFKNFELEASVRAEPNSNGGIFVHTDMSTRDAAKHLAKGYEVQLNSSTSEKRKTGSLYAIVDLDTSPVDETRWFTIRIVVQDKRLTAAINGQPVLDYTEPENVERPPERAGRRFDLAGGAIALQAHDPNSVWYFKDIRVKRLP
jgi:3-keto-disaccharide hydrolase